MERKTKYIDAKKIFANKEKITVNIPQYIYDDMKEYSKLTGENTTEIVTTALFNFFRNKTVTNTDLLGYGNLYFKLPMTASFKSDAIANRIKLNADITTSEPTEQITIATVTNNLDVFNGSTYNAGSEMAKANIKHIGTDFIIIPTALKPTNTIDFAKLDININDALYVFYYEVTSVNIIDVYLINPIDAVNKLSSVKSIKASEKLISCLKELENTQNAINEKYSDEMQELHNNNSFVSNAKEIAIKDKYTAILLDVLNGIAIKYNSANIKIGSDATKYNIKQLNKMGEQHKTEQNMRKDIIEKQEQEQNQ